MVDTPLGVSLEAKLDRLSAQLSKSNQLIGGWAANTQRQVDQVKARFDRLGGEVGGSLGSAQRQIAASTDLIKRQLLGLSGAVSAAFAADRVRSAADGYTRFTNQLRVAGQEGQGLLTTQQQLFDIAQKYGVELEGLGTLYSRAAQAGDTLGASQADLIKFTNGVGAALKIQGGAAAESKGALLQLSQLLGTGTVRAEEFNSVNEGARPILQAVALGIDKYRGSVAALRNDVIAGKVTSQAFFDGFLKGSGELEAKAAKANLTIAASFQVLNNALGKYIGETDASLSATQRFAQGMAALAEHIDEVVPALAVLGTGLAARSFGPMAQGALVAAAAAGKLRVQNELGTATIVGSVNALRQKAALEAQVAAAEASAAAKRVADLQADAAYLARNIKLTQDLLAVENARRAQAATNAAAGFGSVAVGAGAQSAAVSVAATEAQRSRLQQELIAGSKQLQQTETALAAAVTAEAAASARATAAGVAHATAVKATTLAARTGAAAVGLLNTALTFLGGPVGVALIAFTAVILASNAAMKKMAEEAAAAQQRVVELRQALDLAARYGKGASTQIKAVGEEAKSGVQPLREFAGAVGDAAAKLEELAKQRRNEAISALEAARAKAQADVPRLQNEARTLQRAQRAPTGPIEPGSRGAAGAAATVGFNAQTQADSAASAATQKVQAQQALIAQATAEIARLRGLPLSGFVSETDRTGGRNLTAETRDLEAQLKVAQASHNGAAIREIQEQLYIRKQTTKYMKDGLSYEVALATAQKEAANIRSAGDAYASGRASAKAAKDATRDAKAAEVEREREVRAQKAFDADLRSAQTEYLDAVAKTTDSAQDRLKVEIDRIRFARDQRDKEIAAEGPDEAGGTGRYTAAQVASLQALNDQTAVQEEVNALLEDVRRQVADELSLRLAGLENQRDVLELQAGLATTAAARRDAELRLLDLAEEEERARLKAVTVANGATAAAEAEARLRLENLDQVYGLRRQGVLRQTQGPAQAYADANTDAGRLAETLQGRLVDAFDAAAEAAGQAATGAEDFGDAMRSILRQLVAGLISQSIKTAGVNIGSAILSALPGFASGTLSAPGGPALVHKDEVVNLPRGARVTPRSDVLRAIDRLGVTNRAAAPPTIIQPLVDLRGAVIWEGEFARIMSQVDRKVAAGQAQTLRAAADAAPARQRALETLGI